jgi:hypothetical protein
MERHLAAARAIQEVLAQRVTGRLPPAAAADGVRLVVKLMLGKVLPKARTSLLAARAGGPFNSMATP